MTTPNDARAPATQVRHRGNATGVVLVLAGAVLLSLAGISLRVMESASGWQILFYRSLTFFIVIFSISRSAIAPASSTRSSPPEGPDSSSR